MTDRHDDPAAEDEIGKTGEGKKGKSETGTLGRSEVTVDEAYYAKMFSFGATPAQIKQIFANWRHLGVDGVRRALSDFMRRVTSKASAHAQVEFKGNFGLLHNFFDYVKGMRQTQDLDMKEKMDKFNKEKMQHKNQLHPDQNGPKFK